MTIRIGIVDDQRIIRAALSCLLSDESDFEIVGEACNGREAVEMVKNSGAEIILMDVTMPGVDGITATRLIRSACPQTRVIGLSLHDADYMAQLMREAGAVAYLTKDSGTQELVATIRAAAQPAAAEAKPLDAAYATP